jgi:hypothetical protein
MAAEEGEGICSMCPRTDDERRAVPEPPPLEEAPMSDLRCGHQVHTHCLINQLYVQRIRAICEECQVTIMREEESEFFRNRYDDYNRVNRQTVPDLWANNEEFRNDVKDYKKLTLKMSKVQRVYARELKLVKERFKQNVLTSIAMINDQKRQATNELNSLESRKLFKRTGAVVCRKLNTLRRKWDVSSWSLRELNDVQGAPKIPRGLVYYRWRCSPKYIFRLRL